jgi:hypothetical protein
LKGSRIGKDFFARFARMRIRALAMKNKRRDMMMKTKIRYTVAAIAGLCLMSAMSRADLLLEGFEGSINGFGNKMPPLHSPIARIS